MLALLPGIEKALDGALLRTRHKHPHSAVVHAAQSAAVRLLRPPAAGEEGCAEGQAPLGLHGMRHGIGRPQAHPVVDGDRRAPAPGSVTPVVRSGR
jgi:hypothetical protein